MKRALAKLYLYGMLGAGLTVLGLFALTRF
jgi:hypothetical protein